MPSRTKRIVGHSSVTVFERNVHPFRQSDRASLCGLENEAPTILPTVEKAHNIAMLVTQFSRVFAGVVEWQTQRT